MRSMRLECRLPLLLDQVPSTGNDTASPQQQNRRTFMVRSSGRGKTIVRGGVAACVLAFTLGQSSRLVQAQAACGTDLRVLVISSDGHEADLPAITRTLDYLGSPYDVHIASTAPGSLTPASFSTGCHANYQAVITTTGIIDN